MITLDEIRKDLADAKQNREQLAANLNAAIGVVAYLKAKEQELLKRCEEAEMKGGLAIEDV